MFDINLRIKYQGSTIPDVVAIPTRTAMPVVEAPTDTDWGKPVQVTSCDP